MADIRRNQRLIESVDPQTGERIYRDAETGEIVSPGAVQQYSVTEQSEAPATQVTERSVTEHITAPGATQTVSRREQVGTVAGAHTQESHLLLFQLLGFGSESSHQDSYDVFTPTVRDQFVNHR